MRLLNKFCNSLRPLGIIFIGMALILIALSANTTRAASNFSYTIGVDYVVDNSGATQVKEEYRITNNTANQYMDSIKITLPTGNAQDLTIRYDNGSNIPFTQEKLLADSIGYKYEQTQVNIDFPRVNVGKGASWGFIVQYRAPDLVENKGRAHVVYIPGISPENQGDYRVTLAIPKDFGPMHGFGRLPQEIKTGDTMRFYRLNPEDLVDNSLQLLFGDSTTYQANFSYPLENKSGFPKVYKITLPPTTASQAVYINKLDPQPENIYIDSDNNIIASYTVQPNQKLVVNTDIFANINYVEYDLSRSGQLRDIPQNLKSKYTKATKYWNSDNPVIKQKTQEVIKGKSTVAEMTKAINDYVVETLNYNNEKIKYNIRQGSLEAFKNPNNVVCLEYSDLTIAMLRSAGIPARMPVGYGYSGNLKQSSSVSDSLHSWVEAYIPSVGWINLDPTWGEKFNNFGISDIDHFTFAIWGESDTEPVAITEADIDTNYQYEHTTLNYINAKPVMSNDAKLETSKFVILPFVSAVLYRGSAPSNSATFGLRYTLQNHKNLLTRMVGELAPSQGFWGLAIDFGPQFASGATAQLIQSDASAPLVSTRASVVYWPIIMLGTVVTILITWKVIKLRRDKEVKHPVKEPEFHRESKQSTKK